MTGTKTRDKNLPDKLRKKKDTKIRKRVKASESLRIKGYGKEKKKGEKEK